MGDVRDDFKLLLKEGNVGCYKTAEILSIYLIKNNDPINVFTRITFLEEEETFDIKFITLKPIKINENYSLGILEKKVSLDDVKPVIKRLIDLNILKIDKNGDKAKLDDLIAINKVLVPNIMENPVRNMLKDFKNDSYIIEFFSEESSIFNIHLNDKDYRKMCKLILDYLPLDFLFMKDRIGNVIFQFPITIVQADAKFDSDNVHINMEWNPKLKKIPEVEVFAYVKHDNNVVGSATYSGRISHNITLECDNSDGEPVISIKNKNNELFYFFGDLFNMDMNVDLGVFKDERKINLNDKEVKIQLNSCKRAIRMGISTKPYIKRIKDRQYETLTKTLIEEKQFLQYGIGGADDRTKALENIKEIIRDNCMNGVYIWDPYVTSYEILRTAYFCKCYNSKIKVITALSTDKINKYYSSRYENCNFSSFRHLANIFAKYCFNCVSNKIKRTSSEEMFDKWKKEQVKTLESSSNQKGINLEIRCQINQGWNFHDRFLIFPSTKNDKARVWSLGSSINSIGKSHSILMEVKNAQNVLDAFNNLWDKLNKHTVWKYPP